MGGGGGGAEKRAKGGDRFYHYLIFIYDKLTNNRCMYIYIHTEIIFTENSVFCEHNNHSNV